MRPEGSHPEGYHPERYHPEECHPEGQGHRQPLPTAFSPSQLFSAGIKSEEAQSIRWNWPMLKSNNLHQDFGDDYPSFDNPLQLF